MGIIHLINEKTLEISTLRCEVEMALMKALIKYPDEPCFKRHKKEFVSTFKKTQWEHDVNTDGEGTPIMKSGPITIYLGSSTEQHRSKQSQNQHQAKSPVLVESHESVKPLTLHFPDKTPQASNYTMGSSHNLTPQVNTHNVYADKGKEVSRTPGITGSKMVTFEKDDIPSFDLGISPEKSTEHEKGIIQDGRKHIQRLKKPSDKLRSPYVQRAVTFDVTSEEKKLQDWIERSAGLEQ